MREGPDGLILQRARTEIEKLVKKHKLAHEEVSVTARPLTPEEAIGRPTRRDYPIIKGKERVIEARLLGAKGQAFTDSPSDFTGTVEEALQLPLTDNRNRAFFVAVLNALCRHLGTAEGTVHCKDDDPEKCSLKIASHIKEKWGQGKIALIGLNPAIAQALVQTFGAGNIRISDLNRENVNSFKFGVKIEDGETLNPDLIQCANVVLITGTVLVNGTFDGLWEFIQEIKKNCLIYGITGAGICSLLEMERICPFGRNN